MKSLKQRWAKPLFKSQDEPLSGGEQFSAFERGIFETKWEPISPSTTHTMKERRLKGTSFNSDLSLFGCQHPASFNLVVLD